MSAFYITTAIDYANGEPHLGHAYEKIAADAIARFRRLCGDEVHLLVGTDEHGQKVARAAAAAGVAPREQADRLTPIYRRTWDALGIGYQTFVRTTAPGHVRGVHVLIQRILERHPDAFYQRAYEGWYCVGCEAFKTDRDLDGGVCQYHPTGRLERIRERNWFFRLTAHQDFLASFLRERPDFVQPATRRNEVIAFVERGVEDVSVTRAQLDWGIPFPLPDADGRHQAIYVWFDALPSYLTATGYPGGGPGPGAPAWPAQLHVVGKDITRFHCVVWPAILHAAGLPLPEAVWAHGFVTANGQRLSKTAGVWIELGDAIARWGPDALRYFVLREIPFDGDGDFSWERFDARYAADLANTLGNLASRVTALVVRHCDGIVPVADAARDTANDGALRVRVETALRAYVSAFDANLPHRALEASWDALAAANEYITRTAPWLAARDPARRADLEHALGALVRLLARQAVLLGPVIPSKADELWHTLGGPGSVHDQRLQDLAGLEVAAWRVERGEPLFPRPR